MKNCTGCGAAEVDEAPFCRGCGRSFSWTAPTAPAVPAAPLAPTIALGAPAPAGAATTQTPAAAAHYPAFSGPTIAAPSGLPRTCAAPVAPPPSLAASLGPPAEAPSPLGSFLMLPSTVSAQGEQARTERELVLVSGVFRMLCIVAGLYAFYLTGKTLWSTSGDLPPSMQEGVNIVAAMFFMSGVGIIVLGLTITSALRLLTQVASLLRGVDASLQKLPRGIADALPQRPPTLPKP